MNTGLETALQRLKAHFEGDARCNAMYLTGSLARGNADAYSDIDVAVVVPHALYGEVKDELRAVCEQLCGKIVAWLPEGEQPEYVNHAFLFECGADVLLCDLMIVTAELQAQWAPLMPRQVVFDRAGVLRVSGDAPQAASYTAADLSMTLRTYWVYAYLDGKYFRRGDTFKMLYVQYALFLQHVNVFKAFQADDDWGWWAKDVQRLPTEVQRELLVYFGATEPAEICVAFARALDLFSRDARAACERWDMDYPEAMEASVRGHLRAFGVLR